MATRERAGVWFREEKRRRPRLSRERIVEGAVALLDADGVDGLSMRRLAARVGAGTMSLYEYVAGKEDVLDLALDAVMAEIEPADPAEADADWRTALARQATRTREVMRRHPWTVVLLGTRPLLGPNFLLRSERVYAILVRAGLDGRPLIAAVNAVFSYVHGFVAAENAWRGWVRGPGDEAELRRRAQEHLDALADRYPTLARHAQLDYADFDGGFELGLQIVLDGVEARLAGPGVGADEHRTGV